MIDKCVCTFRKFITLCHFIFGLVGFAADKVVYKWISQDSSEAVEKDPGMMISEFDLGSIRTFETTSYYKLGMMAYDDYNGMVIGQFFCNFATLETGWKLGPS